MAIVDIEDGLAEVCSFYIPHLALPHGNNNIEISNPPPSNMVWVCGYHYVVAGAPSALIVDTLNIHDDLPWQAPRGKYRSWVSRYALLLELVCSDGLDDARVRMQYVDI